MTETPRPDWLKCIQHLHVDLAGQSWCGRNVRHEWAFVDAGHAAENGRQRGRLMACPQCVEAVIVALKHDS